MQVTKLSFSVLTGITFFLAISAIGQTKFSNPNVEYEFMLPDEDWTMVVKPSEYSPNVEYIYKDKQDAHLQIRKIETKSDDLFSDIIRDEEQKLQFVPGYVAGKEENFRGALDGRVFNFEFVRSGRPMSGRFYFLRANSIKIYVVRFQGLKDKLRLIRNQTDSIARTFSLKDGQ